MQNNQNSGLVLVVDDEWWVRAFIRLGLEEAGFAVVEAPDAETALAVIDTAPVRVLVTDLDLGGGPDGLALAAAASRAARAASASCASVTAKPASSRPTRTKALIHHSSSTTRIWSSFCMIASCRADRSVLSVGRKLRARSSRPTLELSPSYGHR